MIVIIDYGVGNIKAFVNVYKKLDIPVRIALSAADLEGATKLILPGVGAFDQAMQKLNESGMRQKLDELVKDKKIPVIGVCVGMQMLAATSDEGILKGLGWIDATVKRFDTTRMTTSTHLPHMGWNDVISTKNNPLFNGLEEEARFYFLHSYYFHCTQPSDEISVTEYGDRFTSALNCNNIYGVQFHPEKSHHYGVRLLKNFAMI